MTLLNKAYDFELAKFVDQIIELRKFRLNASELKYNKLLKDELLELVGDDVQVLQAEPFAQTLVTKFKEKFNFSATSDAKALNTFIEQIESFFPDGPLIGRTQMYEAIRKLVITEFVSMGGDLLSFAKQFASSSKIYGIAKSLGDIIPHANLKVAEVVALVAWLRDQIQSKNPGVIDLNVSALGSSLFALCLAQPTKCSEIYSKYVLAKEPVLKEFHPGILAAMFELDKTFFGELSILSKTPDLAVDAVNSLASICNRPDLQLHYGTMDLIEREMLSMDFQTLCQVPRVLATIIKQSNENLGVVERCFSLWGKTVAKDKKVLKIVIDAMSFLGGHDQRIAQILEDLIAAYDIDERTVNQLQHVFYDFKDASAGFKVILALEQKQKIKYHQNFQELVGILQENDAAGCDSELVNLLINDLGLYRFLGRRLLNHLSSARGKRTWAINILELDGLAQYKLCMAVTDDFKEPKYIVPFVAGFMDSKYSLVKELLLHRLHMMTQNYFDDVEESLALYTDVNNMRHAQTLAEVRNYHTQFVASLDRKWKIKELDPKYTHFKYFRLFHSLQQKSFQQNIDENSKQSSLMSLFTNVMLGKGGGYSMNQNDQVQQLSKIEVKMSLPREYFISPEVFDWNIVVGK